jgi:hypothetical protein
MPPDPDDPADVQWPPSVTVDDALALDQLAQAGIGEAGFGEDPHVPADLLELGEVLAWQADAPPVSDAEAAAREEAAGVDLP